MLKIISGKLKGRVIPYAKNSQYRPTTNKMREAIFSIIGSGKFIHENFIENSNFLDLCSGTGAMSFEAISRGCAAATLVDIEGLYLKLAQETAISFGIRDQMRFLRCNIEQLPKSELRHGLVFIDPPYEKVTKFMISNVLSTLIKRDWLAEKVLILIETSRKTDIEDLMEEDVSKNFKLLEVRSYGNSKLSILEFCFSS